MYVLMLLVERFFSPKCQYRSPRKVMSCWIVCNCVMHVYICSPPVLQRFQSTAPDNHEVSRVVKPSIGNHSCVRLHCVTHYTGDYQKSITHAYYPENEKLKGYTGIVVFVILKSSHKFHIRVSKYVRNRWHVWIVSCSPGSANL